MKNYTIIIVSILLIFAMVIFGGCSINHSYTPRAYPISPKLITNQFKSNSTVAVINVAPENRVIMLCWKKGGTTHTYYGDLRKITDTAVSLFSQELGQRGIAVSNSGNDRLKTLKLKVTDVDIDIIYAPWYVKFLIDAMAFPAYTGEKLEFKFRANVKLDVETGSGYKGEYVTNITGFSIYRNCDRSISRAVANALNDPIITDYLK